MGKTQSSGKDPEPTDMERAEIAASELAGRWRDRVLRQASIDVLTREETTAAFAAYFTAMLAHELPARDREDLIGLLRARLLP